jgi:SAM-dependent methyltransferase
VPEDLRTALERLRPLLTDGDRLVRAVAAGRRRGATTDDLPWRRAELRPVRLKQGAALQVVRYDERQAHTTNVPCGEAAGVVDELLGQPWGNWHVEGVGETVQLRVTKKGEAQVHRSSAAVEGGPQQVQTHDRPKPRLLDPGDPLFDVIGGNAAKRRQVDAFLRSLKPVLRPLEPEAGQPLRVVDLGCGNAYLTFAVHRFLTGNRQLPVDLVGVDVKAQAREHNTETARRLGWAEQVRFVEGTILAAPVEAADLAIALHACDTATDEALARAVRWRSSAVLVAPCCHHDLQRQLAGRPGPAPYALVTRHGILRERLLDTLTDSLRAAILRLLGYRVDVVEFIDSAHTPRNVLLRAVRTGAAPTAEQVREYAELVAEWEVRPALAELLADELAPVLGQVEPSAPVAGP